MYRGLVTDNDNVRTLVTSSAHKTQLHLYKTTQM